MIVPTGGPGVGLATLEDAARFVGRSRRQLRPHWDFATELLLNAAKTGKRKDFEAATAQMEGALRVEGWLAMPCKGAIIFSDIGGKLDVLTAVPTVHRGAMKQLGPRLTHRHERAASSLGT